MGKLSLCLVTVLVVANAQIVINPVQDYINKTTLLNNILSNSRAIQMSQKSRTGRPATPVPTPPDPTMFVHSGSPVLPRQLAGQQSEQYFTSMVDLYERTARQDGFPANDLAYAFNYFVVNSYMTYHDLHDVEYSKDPRVKKGRDMFDRITIINQKKTLKPTVYQERAVYKQFKATLKANPAVSQMTDLKKQEVVELLAITFGVNYKDYIDAVNREDERGIERARQQAKTNLEKFTGVPVERLKINESGLQM